MLTYLKPQYDSRANYGNKATVDYSQGLNGTNLILLYSYNTAVCMIHEQETKKDIFFYLEIEKLSNTTMRHLKEFLLQNNYKIGTKKDMIKMYSKKNNNPDFNK